MVAHRASTVRSAAPLSRALSLAKAFSIRAVGRQKDQAGAHRLNGLADGRALVGGLMPPKDSDARLQD
jgi:hypothetical protein